MIAKETVVKNTITTAYARVDRPVTKGPSLLPNYGETKMRANTHHEAALAALRWSGAAGVGPWRSARSRPWRRGKESAGG